MIKIFAPFQVRVGLLRLLLVLDGKPMQEFGGVDQEGYHA